MLCWVERRPREREGASEQKCGALPPRPAGPPPADAHPATRPTTHAQAHTHTLSPCPSLISLSPPAPSPNRDTRYGSGGGGPGDRAAGVGTRSAPGGGTPTISGVAAGGRVGRRAGAAPWRDGAGPRRERGAGALIGGRAGCFFFFRVKEKKRNLAEGKKSFQHTPQLARRGAPPAAHNTHTHTLTARARVRTQPSPQGLRLLLRLCLSHAHTHTPLKAKKNTPGKAHTLSPLLSLFPPSTLHTTTGPVGWGCARVDAGTVAVVMGVVPPAPPATRPVAPPPP